MHFNASKSLVLAFWLCAAPATSLAQTPSETEQLSYPTPPGFTIGYQRENLAGTITELIPSNEAVDHWSTMITVEKLPGMENAIDRGFIKQFVLTFRASCPGSTKSRWVPDLHSNGDSIVPILNGNYNGYRTSVTGIHCPKSPVTHGIEDELVRAIQGQHTLYMIRYTFGYDPTSIDEQVRLNYLKQVKLCDPKGVKHPCS